MNDKKIMNDHGATRRRVLAAGAGVAAGSAFANVQAQSHNDSPMRIIVPFTPGGPTDIVARVVAKDLGAKYKRSVVVENRPGAGSSIGATLVARAEPDGNTLLLTASSHIMSPPLLPPLPYRPVDDFVSIIPVAFQPFVLSVLATDKITTFEQFLEEARRSPEPLSLGVAGIGNGSHYSGLMLERDGKLRFLYVPYNGSSTLQTSMLGGQVRAAFLNPTVAASLIQSGRLRGIAVTSQKRWRQFPDVPTVAEHGFPGFECSAWYAFLGRKGVPQATIDKLYRDIKQILEQPAVRNIILEAGLDPMEQTSSEFDATLKSEYAKWTALVEAAGINKNK